MSVLAEFLNWAAAQQTTLLDSPFRITTRLNSPTSKRSANFEIEEFEIEPNGWVTQNIIRAGSISVWESGEADAFVETRDTLREESGPKYAEHWDHIEVMQLDEAFRAFLAEFPINSGKSGDA